MATRTPAVHATRDVGSTVQPATSSRSWKISTVLRRRLSKIFQREIAESRFGSGGHRRAQWPADPSENLPVAANPPMLAPRVRQVARRVVVVQLDVRDEPRRARTLPRSGHG